MAEEQLPLPLGPQELRASFGDRKLDISRKITACVACRKQKIKCHMPDAQVPCIRCKKRGLPCTVNRSLQMLLEDDASWKHSVTRKIHTLEAFMETVRDKLSLPSTQDEVDISMIQDPPREEPEQRNSNESHRREWEVRMDIESGPAAIPAHCVGEVEDRASSDDVSVRRGDIVNDGIVSLDQAETLFKVYSERLDHYLYHILEHQSTLMLIRSRSPVLLAAICAVGSLHSAELGFLFDKCYEHLVVVSSRLSMSKKVNLDDIRGLCIGAFWLHDISWNLVSIAVRAATQNHLHRAFQKAMEGDRAAYIQTRLWYHVFVCDHHFSVAYGRSPLSRACESTHSAREFITSQHAVEDDARLVSQVEIWSAASKTLDDFGFDVDIPVPVGSIPHLRRYMITLDTWRADWNERFSPNAFVGEYPKKGVGLHFYFAKLYLCSHAFRGLASRASPSTAPGTATPVDRQPPSVVTPGSNSSSRSITRIHPELEEIATVAVHSAKMILKTIIGDAEMRSHLQGLPLYFDTMIIFAIVFLLKVATQYSDTVQFDKIETLNLVTEMSMALKSITKAMHRQHLLVAIAHGVESLVSRCRATLQNGDLGIGQDGAWANGQHAHQPRQEIQLSGNNAWNGMFANTTDMGFEWMNFDFLANQGAVTNEEGWGFGIDYLQS